MSMKGAKELTYELTGTKYKARGQNLEMITKRRQ